MEAQLTFLNPAYLDGVQEAKGTEELKRGEQQFACQAVGDGVAFLEEWLPVGQQGFDFLEQLTLNNAEFARRIDDHSGYIVFT